MYTHTHTLNTCTQHAHTHACTHARTHACTHARTHARTHAHTHARTHTHTHTHTHTRVRMHIHVRVFVCICMCDPKNVNLPNYWSNTCTLQKECILNACSDHLLYMSPEMFPRSIELYRVLLFVQSLIPEFQELFQNVGKTNNSALTLQCSYLSAQYTVH